MGVDAKVFVIANYPFPDTGFVQHVFSLHRDRGLWEDLETVLDAHSHKVWDEIQLPSGGHSTYEGGRVPEGFDDYEAGHLQENPYGGSLRAVKGKHFKQILKCDFHSESCGWNDLVLQLLVEQFPENDVIIYWH